MLCSCRIIVYRSFAYCAGLRPGSEHDDGPCDLTAKGCRGCRCRMVQCTELVTVTALESRAKCTSDLSKVFSRRWVGAPFTKTCCIALPARRSSHLVPAAVSGNRSERSVAPWHAQTSAIMSVSKCNRLLANDAPVTLHILKCYKLVRVWPGPNLGGTTHDTCEGAQAQLSSS